MFLNVFCVYITHLVTRVQDLEHIFLFTYYIFKQ